MLCAVLSLALWAVSKVSLLNEFVSFHRFYPYLIVFFFIQAIVVIKIVEKGSRKKEESSMYILGAISARFISGLFAILIFYAMKVEDLIGLSIQFVVLYLLYLVFELTVLLSNLRRNS